MMNIRWHPLVNDELMVFASWGFRRYIQRGAKLQEKGHVQLRFALVPGDKFPEVT